MKAYLYPQYAVVCCPGCRNLLMNSRPVNQGDAVANVECCNRECPEYGVLKSYDIPSVELQLR